jgi:hypothetical protein
MEKNYIIELTQKHRTSKVINWKYVICGLERQFGKLYSENSIKNYWYVKHRKDEYNAYRYRRYDSFPSHFFDDAKYQEYFPILSIMERTSHEPKFNKPYKMQPLYGFLHIY